MIVYDLISVSRIQAFDKVDADLITITAFCMDKAYDRMHNSYTMNKLEQLFPKVRSEILRLLFLSPGRSLHLRGLARLSGLAVGTIQREVRTLLNAELISRRRDGNRLYFEANIHNPIFPELRGLTLKTSGLAEQMREGLSSLKGIEFAFVFGSCADGSSDYRSDVDLFVIGSIGLRELAPKLRLASVAMGREINPTAIARKSFEEKLRKGDAFLSKVVQSEKLWVQGNQDEFESMA